MAGKKKELCRQSYHFPALVRIEGGVEVRTVLNYEEGGEGREGAVGRTVLNYEKRSKRRWGKGVDSFMFFRNVG